MQDSDSKLNSIVGAALKALAESGADDEFIGAFAATHRAKVAGVLGLAPAAPAGPPDLVELVRGAVRSVLTETGLASPGLRPAAKRIYVKVEGRRTSVTVAPGLFLQVAESNGGPARALSMIRDLAAEAPRDVANRSGWVEQRLLAIVQLSAPGAESSRAH